MDQINELWIDGITPVKIVVSNWIRLQWSTAKSFEPNELSGVFMIGRTRILWSLEGFGPLINIVALQLSNLVQNEDHDGALKWRSHLSWNLAWQGYLVIWRCWKRFHTIWINQNGTSFTNIPTDQKLAEILEGKWLNGLSHNLVEVFYMDRRRPRKTYSHNEAR